MRSSQYQLGKYNPEIEGAWEQQTRRCVGAWSQVAVAVLPVYDCTPVRGCTSCVICDKVGGIDDADGVKLRLCTAVDS